LTGPFSSNPISEIRDDELTTGTLANRYPPTGYVVDSVRLSILAAIESDELMDSIKSIVEFGWDTDTNASMFGNIYGAIHGTEGLPMETIRQVDEYHPITHVADQLSRVAIADS
jgi:ADP-ribosylglycohydrolase